MLPLQWQLKKLIICLFAISSMYFRLNEFLCPLRELDHLGASDEDDLILANYTVYYNKKAVYLQSSELPLYPMKSSNCGEEKHLVYESQICKTNSSLMAVSTGKRKRTSGSDYDSSSTSSLDESAGVAEGYEDTFRRHFEARFYPLQNDKNDPAQQRKVRAEGTREESSDEPSDWSGFSSGDDERAPVVYHRNISQLEKPSKSESRSFMVRRPNEPFGKFSSDQLTGHETSIVHRQSHEYQIHPTSTSRRGQRRPFEPKK